MKTALNYNLRVFVGVSNSSNGEVSSATRFVYHQDGERLWGEYSGGSILSGHLQGRVFPDGSLEFLYHHENVDGALMAGRCESPPVVSDSGRLQLRERWQWFTGDQSAGESIVEEAAPQV